MVKTTCMNALNCKNITFRMLLCMGEKKNMCASVYDCVGAGKTSSGVLGTVQRIGHSDDGF